MSAIENYQEYAGDVSPKEAWDLLENNQDAVLVDVRTRPEWEFVGLPDLALLGREPILVEWQNYVSGQNLSFVDDIQKAGILKEAPILLLCRSGVRSLSAAVALTAAGFQTCYNIADGFEGQLDENRHRGARGTGWKACDLPWLQ